VTISELAFLDNENIYDLWDKDTTMGCKCDPGYAGPDCSERECKVGIDPLWTDDTTARVTHTTVKFETVDSNVLSGEYAITFFDVFGEDYITEPLALHGTGVINSVTHCASVVAALKALPNGVVPEVECSQNVISTDKGFEYTLTFTGNPGELRELELVQHLDGARSTVLVASGAYTVAVHTKVTGETTDHFAERCEGLTVKILADSLDSDDSWSLDVRPGSLGYITGESSALSAAEAKLLKKCLGNSDKDMENNVEVSNWDYGNVQEAQGAPATAYNMIGAYPHAIKIVPKETSVGYDKYKYGEYHLVWYDPNAAAGKEFRVANLNNGANIHSEAVESYVYTTQGRVQQMGWGAEADDKIAENPTAAASSNRIVAFFDAYTNKLYTNYDTSCENQPTAGSKNHVCVEKGDQLFIVDSCWSPGDLGAGTTSPFFGGPTIYNCADSTSVNYNTGNIYTVTKVYTVPKSSDSTTDPTDWIDVSLDPSLKQYVNTYVIEVNANIGWEGIKGDPENTNLSPSGSRDNTWSDNTGIVTLFHFTPASEGNYEYASQCSNRGLCDKKSGICQCFKGYTGDDCSLQNALAM